MITIHNTLFKNPAPFLLLPAEPQSTIFAVFYTLQNVDNFLKSRRTFFWGEGRGNRAKAKIDKRKGNFAGFKNSTDHIP